MEDAIEILTISEPDKKGMITMELEFNDIEFFNEVKKIAEENKLTIEEFIIKALEEFVDDNK